MEARVTWKGKMAFEGSADSSFVLPLDAKPEVGGEENGFQPLELMAVSLAGCTAMDVISILSKKRQNVTAFEVSVHAERAREHPRVITSAVISYQVTGKQVDEAALVRAIELSAVRYCPAQAMLARVFPIAMNYSIYEDEGETRRLVTTGSYTPTGDPDVVP